MGFINTVRKKLNLPLLIEAKENVFLERYKFTAPFYDALALKILFGKDALFILDAAAKINPKSFIFSPVNQNLIEKIRLIDFIKNYNVFLKQKIDFKEFKEIVLNNEKYKNFLKNVFEKYDKDQNLE